MIFFQLGPYVSVMYSQRHVASLRCVEEIRDHCKECQLIFVPIVLCNGGSVVLSMSSPILFMFREWGKLEY